MGITGLRSMLKQIVQEELPFEVDKSMPRVYGSVIAEIKTDISKINDSINNGKFARKEDLTRLNDSVDDLTKAFNLKKNHDSALEEMLRTAISSLKDHKDMHWRVWLALVPVTNESYVEILLFFLLVIAFIFIAKNIFYRKR